MALIVTEKAVITCMHGGRVTLKARQAKVMIQGGLVLCDQDLVGAPIAGCPQAGPGIKPCTSVLSTAVGSASRTVTIAGRGVYLSTLDGETDGSPPSPLIVSNPGQTVAQA